MTTTNLRSRRSFAAIAVAVVGVFLVSSGFALSSGAYATKPAPEHKVDVCHATSSDTNPYVFINVDIASTGGGLTKKFQGHLMHRDDPNKHWQHAGSWNGRWHDAGDLKADFINSYSYQGVNHDLDGDIVTPGFCAAQVAPPTTVGEPSFTDPGCPPKPATGSYTTPDHVTLTVASGDTDPDDSITLHGVAAPGYEFADHSTAKDFTHSFPAMPETCGAEEEPPLDATASQQVEQPSCENQGVGSLSVSGEHITLSPSSPQTGGPGAHVSIVATAASGHLFDDESDTKSFGVTFDSFDGSCGEPELAAPVDPTFADPTCDNQDGADVVLPEDTAVLAERKAALVAPIVKQGTADGVLYTVTGAMGPGGTVDVDATPAPGFVFTEPLPRTHWSHTFTDIVAAGTTPSEGQIVCGAVVEPPEATPPRSNPPVVNHPVGSPPKTVPQVVDAGLATMPGTPAPAGDLRDLGGSLVGGGALLLAMAGWLALGRRPRRATS